MALLTPRGFTLTKIGEGLTLQALAQAAFNTRQTSIGGQKGSSSVAGGDDKTVRQAYADFPETARANFTSPADRSALGLNGKVPADFEKFLTTARASYQAAKGAAYSDTMAEYGYPSDKLDDELDSLMDLENSATDHNSAQGAAQTATKVRNQAHATLMTWMRKFRRIAKVALRGQPDLRQKLAM